MVFVAFQVVFLVLGSRTGSAGACLRAARRDELHEPVAGSALRRSGTAKIVASHGPACASPLVLKHVVAIEVFTYSRGGP